MRPPAPRTQPVGTGSHRRIVRSGSDSSSTLPDPDVTFRARAAVYLGCFYADTFEVVDRALVHATLLVRATQALILTSYDLLVVAVRRLSFKADASPPGNQSNI